MEYTIKCGKTTAKISSLGAHLLSLTDNCGKERMWCADERYWGKCAPWLFPICGRLLDSRYTYGGKEYELETHGFAKSMEWQLEEAEEAYLKLSLKEDEESMKKYPFPFYLCAEFWVKDNELTAKVTVKNTGDTVMPYMFGWHPGFALFGDKNAESYIELPEVGELKIHKLKDGKFPKKAGIAYCTANGKIRIDNDEMEKEGTLVLSGAGCRAVLKNDGYNVAARMSWSDNLPNLCIWKVPEEGAKYICIEPWSDMPNDGECAEIFESRDMSRLPIGQVAVYEYKVEF